MAWIGYTVIYWPDLFSSLKKTLQERNLHQYISLIKLVILCPQMHILRQFFDNSCLSIFLIKIYIVYKCKCFTLDTFITRTRFKTGQRAPERARPLGVLINISSGPTYNHTAHACKSLPTSRSTSPSFFNKSLVAFSIDNASKKSLSW